MRGQPSRQRDPRGFGMREPLLRRHLARCDLFRPVADNAIADGAQPIGAGASPLDDPVIAGLQRLREQQWLFKPVAGANRNFGGIASPDPDPRDFIPKPGFDYGFLFPTRWPKGHPEAPRQWGYWPQIIRDPVTALADTMQGGLYDVNRGREDTAPSYVLPPSMTLALMGMAGLGTKPAGALGSGALGRSVPKVLRVATATNPDARVLINPTQKMIEAALARSQQKALRAMTHPVTGDVAAWDAMHDIHQHMAHHLGWESYSDPRYIFPDE
jgi:hypothetical protein